MERTYCGKRGAGVTVNGAPLAPRNDLRNHSPDGFEWGYGGSGPAQLALAICADALGDDERALRVYQDFKFRAIATIPHDEWRIERQYVLDIVREIEGVEPWFVVKVEGEQVERPRAPLIDLIEQNPEDDELCNWLRRARVDAWRVFGGGAAPTVYVRRVA